MVLNPLSTLPVSKNTSHALFGLPAIVVADQYASISTLVKGWPGGRVGPVLIEGSTRLASSITDGSLQPLRPPTSLSAHATRAAVHDSSIVSRVFSHTSPVSSSRTAAPPKALKIVNRETLGSFLSQLWVGGETSVVGLGFDGEAAKALPTPTLLVNKLPTKTQSPGISMERLDNCIVLLMRSLQSLWWLKVWATLRLETQRVNTFDRAAMDSGLRVMLLDCNPHQNRHQERVRLTLVWQGSTLSSEGETRVPASYS